MSPFPDPLQLPTLSSQVWFPVTFLQEISYFKVLYSILIAPGFKCLPSSQSLLVQTELLKYRWQFLTGDDITSHQTINHAPLLRGLCALQGTAL